MKYDNYAPKLNFNKNKNVYERKVDGFKVYLKDWQYMVLSIASFYIPTDKEILSGDKKKIEAEIDNACALYTVSNTNDTLIVTLSDGKKDSDKTLDAINKEIEDTVKLLKEMGYNPMKVCPICKKEAEYLEFGDDFIPMHEDCKASFVEKLEAKVKQESGFNIKYVISILLSILFAGIGIIPAILWTYFGHDYFTLVIVLSPIGSVLGYYLSHATPRRWLRIVTGIIPLIIIACFMVFAFNYIAEYKEMTIGAYLGNFKYGLRKLIFGSILAFAGFGLTRYIYKFQHDNAKRLKKFKD